MMTSLSTPIRIIRPETIEFGCETIAAAARFAQAKGAKRPLVIADAFNAAHVDLLALPGDVSVFGEVRPEPDIPNLEKALQIAGNAAPDVVIGFGGGSAMDLAKLVAVLGARNQTLADVAGVDKVAGRSVALVQVPTTSGTGSEGGIRALVTDPATRNKVAVQSPFMLADLAVVDPDLTMTVRRRSARRPVSMRLPTASRPSPAARHIPRSISMPSRESASWAAISRAR
jgi:alcohol dehydrogenase